MAYGDHIFVVRRAGYAHHGVDVGDGRVIHLNKEFGEAAWSVHESSLNEFRGSGAVQVRLYGKRFGADTAVQRAESMIGRRGYDLLFDNCEHFATWCVAGEHSSAQVETVMTSAAVTGIGVAGPNVGLGLVTELGTGAALSGPNLMSGLAAIGGTVTVGLAVTAGCAGAATAYGMSKVLPDKEFLPDDERAARKIGRYAAGGGAVIGTVAGVHAVGAMGLTGYSAVGLSTGFASLGAVMGGGMSQGVLALIALPAALAVLLGLVAYALAKTWLDRPASRFATAEPSHSWLTR